MADPGRATSRRGAGEVLIIGAGIAGASLTIMLRRNGAGVTVIEREPHGQPLSSGIFLYSNALASLDRIGVLGQVLAHGYPIDSGRSQYLDESGDLIAEVHYRRHPGTALPPLLGIKRSVLRDILAAGMRASGAQVRTGCEVVSVHDDPNRERVEVACTDGSRHQVDAVIGADGIRSDLRTRLLGPIIPRNTGFGVWRSVHRRPAEIDYKILMMGTGKRYGIMPISRTHLYVYATSNEAPGTRHDRVHLHTLMRERFAEFSGPATRFLAELREPEDVVYTAVEEIDLPLPWSVGRVGLIGDAAHASSPFLGQGGAMALEDAVVLGERLPASTDVAATLADFPARRQPKCHFVQVASRGVGEAGGIEREADRRRRDERMRSCAQADIDDFYARLDAFDASSPTSREPST